MSRIMNGSTRSLRSDALDHPAVYAEKQEPAYGRESDSESSVASRPPESTCCARRDVRQSALSLADTHAAGEQRSRRHQQYRSNAAIVSLLTVGRSP